ncbi:MAG: DNA alkylation repair protein [Actinobacteria bacterium]|nr:DNA alkylation repair protein [Actinomycetota bacterium]
MSTRERLTAVMDELAARTSEESRAGMARYGINVADAFGVSVPELRRLARALGTDHDLALALWDSGNHEARLLASMVDDPAAVTEAQMDRWAADFDSWDVCDQVTSNLFDKTPFAYDKVGEWSTAEDEWIKRAAFATAAALAVQDKKAPDERFLVILALVRREAGDGRNFVKKAVNWALRNIGKRNAALHAAAIDTAEAILASADALAAVDRRDPAARSARWVARDALRELRSNKVLRRF